MRAESLSFPRLDSRLHQMLIILATAGLSLIGLLVSATLLFQLWFAGRIFPGVSVAGVPVGGLTPTAAAQRLAQEWTFPQTGRILLQDKERVWLFTPQQLGLFLDAQASAEQAFRLGRSGSLLTRFNDQLTALYSGSTVAPVLIFDQRIAHQQLVNLAREIDRPVLEASLGLQGTEVIVRSGEIGRTLDVEASLLLLTHQLQTLTDGVVPLIVRETPPLILDASAQAEVARRILSQPLTITLPEDQPDYSQVGPWVFDPPTLAGMLTIERVQNEQGATYQVTLQRDALLNFLSNLAPNLAKDPQNARFIFNDDTHQLELIQHAVIGRRLNIEASLRTIQEKVTQGEHTVALVFDYNPPPVTDDATAEQLGIRELIHAETSYFYGSSRERVQNIQAAAARFHGLLVAPGEVFSMAQALGDITLDNGYAEALIIVGNQTIKGVGGGVCQVSTTLFRAAFFAGYPIIERHAHAYRVYYYEKVAGNRINPRLAGLDATVFVPLVDFKFKNDTPYWLLMETYVNPAASTLTWKFYSTSDGRHVEWDTTGPINVVDPPPPLYRENPDLAQGEIKQVDWEAQGADVIVTRTVYRNGEVYLQDTFKTHYRPWQAVYEYGPGTEVPTPESDGG